jgi:XTP/dITP diphosphohydrolase
MKIVLATKNKKKAEEIRRIIEDKSVCLYTLDDFPDCPQVEEDGKTFEENAVKKAVTIAKQTGLPSIADDSGLEVDALDGAPGIYSARYSGKDSDDKKNIKKLLSEMQYVEDKDRGARFVCSIVFASPDGQINTCTEYCEGTIGIKPEGSNGFGYDPVFYPAGYKKTFAEMTEAEKDEISHRGKAIKKLAEFLRKH